MTDSLYRGFWYRVNALFLGRAYARLVAEYRAEMDAVQADRERRGVALPEDGWVAENTTWTVSPEPDVTYPSDHRPVSDSDSPDHQWCASCLESWPCQPHVAYRLALIRQAIQDNETPEWAAEDMTWLLEHAHNMTDERDRVVEAVRHALELHKPLKIYGECGHEHEYGDPGTVDVENVGLTCQDGFETTICLECCALGMAQTEECASNHPYASGQPCWPCPTWLALEWKKP